MPGKQVLQSTFDAIVREAMSDFGLSAVEAVADAREQLAKVGVTDFSNIVDPTEGGENQDEQRGIELPRQLQEVLESPGKEPELIELLSELRSAGSVVASIAGANGATDALIQSLERGLTDARDGKWGIADAACKAIVAVCGGNEVNRTRFVSAVEKDGVEVLKQLLEVAAVLTDTDGEDSAHLIAVLRAIRSVQEHNESVKQRVARDASIEVLLRQFAIAERRLASPFDLECSSILFKSFCAIFQQLLVPDDASATISETFNRARIVTGRGTISESGLRPLDSVDTLPQILYRAVIRIRTTPQIPEKDRDGLLDDCIGCVRVCAVSDEVCSDLILMEFHTLATSVLKEKPHEARLVCSCLNLLRNLAQRDQCKTALSEEMDIIQKVADSYLEKSHIAVEYFTSFVANLCLRRPDLSRMFAKNGVFDIVIKGMKIYEKKRKVQRSGCLAIRNACSRDVEARRIIKEGGIAEVAVRLAWKLFPRDCDELAYNALRELDVLRDDELRRDTRYTMPAGFFKIKPSEVVETGIGFDDIETS